MNNSFNSFSRIIRALSVVLVVIMCVQLFPIKVQAAHDYTSVKSILNNAKLHPQKTGFRTMDQKVESMLKDFRKKGTSTFDLMVAAYDWFVYNVKYDRSITYYPYYDFDSKTKSPVPFYAVYFAYDPLFMKEGVCDNFSSAYAIIARAIGLDAYLRYGKQVTSSATYDHMWVEIIIDGVGYVFDPQSDNSVYNSRGYNNHIYFGVPAASSSMYRVQDGRINNSKFYAAFTPVGTSLPVQYYYVKYQAVGDGSVSASPIKQSSAQATARSAMFVSKNYSYQFSGWLADTYIASSGTKITLDASADSGAQFLGWYVNGKQVSTYKRYILKASDDVLVQALFSGAGFTDVPSGKWYYDAVYFCFKKSLMSGTSLTTFSPSSNMTRAMAVTVIAKMAKADLSKYEGKKSSFKDVKKGSWYAASVEWANANGIASGYGNKYFGPNDNITREQFATMLCSLAGFLKYGNRVSYDLSKFSDSGKIHAWALNAMKWACKLGIIAGNEKKQLLPRSVITRAEAATMVMKFVKG